VARERQRIEKFCRCVARAGGARLGAAKEAELKLVWFCYPFLASGSGEMAKAIEDFLAARGYKIAPVSVDYHDYSYFVGYLGHVRAGDRQKAVEQFATVPKCEWIRPNTIRRAVCCVAPSTSPHRRCRHELDYVAVRVRDEQL
jgi:hypothetical protein